MPLLVAFLLFLVLSNVSLSVESSEQVVASSNQSNISAAQRPVKAAIVTASHKSVITADLVRPESMESDGDVSMQYRNENEAAKRVGYFSCTDNSTCKTLLCSGGPIFKIFTDIEYFVKWCGTIQFDVIIENCTFSQNTINAYTFSGDFKMTTLTIRNCQLDTILDNAFKQRSVSELKNLTFAGVQLRMLNAHTFNGLETVETFQLFNVAKAGSPMKANNFLQPMAASLNSVVLQQSDASGNPNVIYNPTGWLGGSITTAYSKLLYVDLSGTNFNDTLNGNTFAKLSAVQELRLANCSLSTIAADVFKGILSTLKSLDLRSNHLRTLDGAFLATAVAKGISIELGWNLWSCDCDNVEIVEYMKQIEHNSAAETVCATPTELQSTQIRDAQMRCDGSTMLTTTITTLTTTAATTPTTSETSTIMTTTEEDTTEETTESYPATKPTESSPKASPTMSSSPLTTTMLTTAGDTTEKTTEFNPETSTTYCTTEVNSSPTPIISTETTTMPSTADDTTQEITISNTNTSIAATNTITTTTADDKTEKTTTSNPKTSAETSPTPPITPINNSTTSLSSITTTMQTNTDDITKETTETDTKTSPTLATTPINNATTVEANESGTKTTLTPTENTTSPTLLPTTAKIPTTADDTTSEITEAVDTPISSTPAAVYSTTLSTSSSAASIHRWRW